MGRTVSCVNRINFVEGRRIGIRESFEQGGRGIRISKAHIHSVQRDGSRTLDHETNGKEKKWRVIRF
jgi:hypothetical protein